MKFSKLLITPIFDWEHPVAASELALFLAKLQTWACNFTKRKVPSQLKDVCWNLYLIKYLEHGLIKVSHDRKKKLKSSLKQFRLAFQNTNRVYKIMCFHRSGWSCCYSCCYRPVSQTNVPPLCQEDQWMGVFKLPQESVVRKKLNAIGLFLKFPYYSWSYRDHKHLYFHSKKINVFI